MRKSVSGFEDVFFLGAAFVSLIAAATGFLLRPGFHFHKERVQYGMNHLPAALSAIFLFVVLVGLLRVVLANTRQLAEYPTSAYVGALLLAYCIFWLPVLLAGGFVQDDWMLLAAASIRKIIYLHPTYSWSALDSVDGNFRPLSTVLYVGYMLKVFGPWAPAFLLGNFLLTLLSSLTIFLIVREMGYSKLAGTAASLLFMSRGMLYTVVSWMSAVSDGLALLLCGLMALAILKANRRRGLQAALYHGGAWSCFCLATLAKQSSFAAPLVVALLLLLRPGEDHTAPLLQRIRSAALGLLVYTATAIVPFLHAEALLRTTSPYPISLSLTGALRSFSYGIWYVTTCDLPAASPYARTVPEVAGMVVVAVVVLVVRRVPRLLGDRPRDVFFAALAAVASISLFLVLRTRLAPYYGAMAAFWLSIALGIALTRFGPPDRGKQARVASFGFCLLLVSGYADIRMRQTALVPAGGYTWGTYGMDRERLEVAALQEQFHAAPEKDRVVLIDFPPPASYYSCMALLFEPHLRNVLTYDSRTATFAANNLLGQRPGDTFEALQDPLAYNWTTPISEPAAEVVTSPGSTLWLRFRDGNIEAVDSIRPGGVDAAEGSKRSSNDILSKSTEYEKLNGVQ